MSATRSTPDCCQSADGKPTGVCRRARGRDGAARGAGGSSPEVTLAARWRPAHVGVPGQAHAARGLTRRRAPARSQARKARRGAGPCRRRRRSPGPG